MGPRLAPLALLLLALCGLPSCVSALAKYPEISDNKIAVAYSKTSIEYGDVFEAAATLFVHGQEPKTGDAKKALDNGVLCAFKEDANLADTLKKAVYGDAPRSDTEEEKFARFNFVDCDTSDTTVQGSAEFKCVCTDKKLVVYCAAEKYKNSLGTGVTATTCAKDELAKIRSASSLLADHLDLVAHKQNYSRIIAMELLGNEDVVDKLTSNGDAEKAKFYCAAIDSDVDNAVKALTFGSLIYQEKVANTVADRGFTGFCTDGAKKETWFGNCVCSAERRIIQFCMFHAQAQYLKEEGYLSCCKGDEKFIADKKPTGPLDFKNPKKAQPIATPACSTTPGNVTTEPTTTKSPDAAATAFSLLATAAALAAALLHN